MEEREGGCVQSVAAAFCSALLEEGSGFMSVLKIHKTVRGSLHLV